MVYRTPKRLHHRLPLDACNGIRTKELAQALGTSGLFRYKIGHYADGAVAKRAARRNFRHLVQSVMRAQLLVTSGVAEFASPPGKLARALRMRTVA